MIITKRPVRVWAGLIVLASVIVGWLSVRPAESDHDLSLILLASVILGWLRWRSNPPMVPPASLREVQPEATAVVPTLDTPIPDGKSALWCASFQMAWERFEKIAAKGPVKLTGAEETAQRLNDAPSVADTVNEEDTYAAGGLVRDGIVTEIKQEMARRFPEVTVGELEEFPGGAVVYGYLRAAVKFTIPFLESEHPLEFVAADGSKTAVCSFGLPYGTSRRSSVEKQVEILHGATVNGTWETETFVLDLCKYTSPYQVLVARIPRQPTLAALLADMEQRIAGKNDEQVTGPLGSLDEMLIPHLRFRIIHHFEELEGKTMPDLGMTFPQALQRIDFRLDAAGAVLSSESLMVAKALSRHFHADRPFLVVMRKRGATRPFFTLWVENGELLEAWPDKL
jgi:hypothetical protein